MESNKDVKNIASNGNSANNLSKILSSYLPKDVLEEIDINDSSKTNSLSKNSSSDNSMGKSTKSQTNNNNGNNNNSDSNGSGSNNNKGNNSDTSGNSKNDINNINLRKIYHSYPKNDTYMIKHKLKKYFLHENNYQGFKESNHNPIKLTRINRSFSGRKLNRKNCSLINSKNKSTITIKNIVSKSKNDINMMSDNNMNRKNLHNSDKNLSTKWNLSNEKKSKQLKLIYSHPNLNNTYKITNNPYEFNILNNCPKDDINRNGIYENNIMNGHNSNGINLNKNKIYNMNNINVNNGYYNNLQNKMKAPYPIAGSNRYNNISNGNNINKSQLNIGLRDLYHNVNISNGINHSFNYVNTINNKMNHSMNGNKINLFPKNNGDNTYTITLINSKGAITISAKLINGTSVITTAPAKASAPAQTSSDNGSSSSETEEVEAPFIFATFTVTGKTDASAEVLGANRDSADETFGLVSKPVIKVAAGNLTAKEYRNAFIKAVKEAPQGGIVRLETAAVSCIDKTMMAALAERPDVTLEVVFPYAGNTLDVTVPAGTDVMSLLDENGYCGFLYLNAKF